MGVEELSGDRPTWRGDEGANAGLVGARSDAEAAAPERVALWQGWAAWFVGYLLVAAGLWWLLNALYFGVLLSSGGEVCDGMLESMAQSRLGWGRGEMSWACEVSSLPMHLPS